MTHRDEHETVSTDIDRFHEHLHEVEEASISQIAEALNLAENQVRRWATILDEEGVIDRERSLTRGTLISIAESS